MTTERDPDREAEGGDAPLWKSTGLRIVLAAAIVVVLGILIRGTPRSTEPPEVEPDGAVPATTPPDHSELASPPAVLAWPPVEGATGYRARLSPAGGEPLWEGEPTERAQVELPPEIVEALEPGGSYVWTVEVEGPAEPQPLGPFRFRLELAPER